MDARVVDSGEMHVEGGVLYHHWCVSVSQRVSGCCWRTLTMHLLMW